MTVWRLVTHHVRPEALLTWATKSGHIAMGWNSVGELTQDRSEEEIKRIVHKTGNPNWAVSGKQLLAFRNEIQKGDLVILSTGKQRCAVVRVDGDYAFAGEGLRDEVEYAHRRSATAVLIDAETLWKSAGGLAEGQNPRWTLVRCRYGVLVDGTSIERSAR